LSKLISNWKGYRRKKLWNNFRYQTGICMEKLRMRIIKLVSGPRYEAETSQILA
jgi:hypothetical protein